MEKNKLILIADDAEVNRNILQMFFQDRFDTLVAADGEEAIAHLKERGDAISLVLLDLVMPKKDGFDVLQYMQDKGLTKTVPVIVITGSEDYQDELRAYNKGAADIIHKPFVPEIVLRRAENAMELFGHRLSMERQLAQSQKELEDAHRYDALTGLYNMQVFLEEANKLLRKAEEEGDCSRYAFVYGNIRNFKYVNLNSGIEEGDLLLKKLADRIREGSVPPSVHSRFGNDHIVSMIPAGICEEQVRALSERFHQEYGNTTMKMKVGIYYVTKKGENAAAASDLAKVACDTISDSNEAVCVYTDQIARQTSIANYVETHLDEAIQNNYIKVYYQPVIRTISGAFCGMEALARWIDPVMGFLSPADFISVLERRHLITKLDLHMLRLICKEMKAAEEKNLKLIPVSFNLSRIDLLECDIFNEVENILREYSIPRDLINVEITESTFAENQEFMQKIIGSFRDAGYQVWMDDFGSEYSSLNFLKDYKIDEIKLDMKFLSGFDDSCKTIIRSVIRMAKELGVQTLAEGVETKEQLDFLREVGCEKAQGYYFSKPLPNALLYPIMEEKGGNVEERGWRSYYDSIGTVNFITDRSLAIVEFAGKDFRLLFENDAFKSIWTGLGAEDEAVITQAINSDSSPLGRQLHDMQHTLHRGDAQQDLITSVNGRYIRLSVKCLAEHEDHGCYSVEITNLISHEDEQKHDKLDKVFRDMYSLYDAIYVVDLDTGALQTLMQGSSNHLEEFKKFHSKEIADVELAAKAFIHPKEREEFAKFVDMKTLKKRIDASGRGYIVHYFRATNGQGAYNWTIHTMLYIPQGNYVVYCVRAAFFDQPGLVEKLAPEYLAQEAHTKADNTQHVLRQTIMESKTVNVFWKDKNRRFTNVNEKFLDTYGFKDISAVLGKTDEEMGWHVDNAPFQDDELDVLKNGKVINNRIGRCIIKGVDHVIIASKEPIYEHGEIVGLVGNFLVADEVNGMEELARPKLLDQATNLMSAAGRTDEMSRFVEEWRIKQENFAVIRITLPEYFRISRTYSEQIAKGMLHEVSAMIAENFGVHGTCARLFGGNFSVLMQCHEDKENVKTLCEAIRVKLAKLHTLTGYPVTLNPKIEVYFADEMNDIQSMISLATGGTAIDFAERKKVEEQLNTFNLQLSAVVDAIPGGVVLYEMLPDNSHRVLYSSTGIGSLSGQTKQEFLNKDLTQKTNGMYEPDMAIVHHAIVDTVRKGLPLNMKYRIWHKNGSLVWVNIQGRVIGEQDGNPLLLAVYQNVSEAAK